MARRTAGAQTNENSTKAAAVARDGRNAANELAMRFDQVVIGRRRQYRIEIRLAYGSITDVDSRAYVLGMFRNVAPSGPAKALDARLGGAIDEFTTRRMFAANVGEVSILPTGRHPVQADLILFVGLGTFDCFDDSVQVLAAENVIRMFLRTGVEEFATVLFGGGSVRDPATSLGNLLTGFFRGLKDADRTHWFRGFTLCEMDSSRYETIKRELYRLSSTELFEDVEVILDEIEMPVRVEPAAAVQQRAQTVEPAYLIVRSDGAEKKLRFNASVLTAGAKAAVISASREVSRRDLDRQLKKLEPPGPTWDEVADVGKRLAELMLADDVSKALHHMRDRHLVVVHDAEGSRVPWETLRIQSWQPAAAAGMSRRYLAQDLSVAKWLEARRHDQTLDILLVVNPTGDLAGAEEEGRRVRELFAAYPAVQIQELHGPRATRSALADAFQSGRFDVIHYAGHAYFDQEHRAESGIICHGGEVLSGADLSTLGNLPSLVFFNACEAGRVRLAAGSRGSARKYASKPRSIQHRILENVGLAEAFLRGGVANYIGTYWPVGDEAAKRFAAMFYVEIIKGRSIGESLLAGRAEIQKIRSPDWADYIHYGSHDFALKQVR